MASEAEIISTAPRRRVSQYWTRRTAALDELVSLLSNQIVLVKGPAGVGKTVLLTQLHALLDRNSEYRVASHVSHGPTSAEELRRAIAYVTVRSPGQKQVLLVDSPQDGDGGIDSEVLLDALRINDDLTIVVATRHSTVFESPLTALEFDAQVLDPARLTFNADEAADVMTRNGVLWNDDALRALREQTASWPALVQLSGAHLRLNGHQLRTSQNATDVAELALDLFTDDVLSKLPFAITDDMRLSAIAPFLTSDLATAIGIDKDTVSSPDFLRQLERHGVVWPSRSRMVLAEPIRTRWTREIMSRHPDEVAAARHMLAAHLLTANEPLLAANAFAEAGDWESLADTLYRNGPSIWRRDREQFSALVRSLRTSSMSTPLVTAAVLAFDADASAAQDAAEHAFIVLEQSTLAKKPPQPMTATRLAVRVQLLRSSGKHGLSSEATLSVAEVARHESGAALSHLHHEAGLTHFMQGRMRAAASSFILSLREAKEGAARVRARGSLALLHLLEGDVHEAATMLDALTADGDDEWIESPWGETARIAGALLALEQLDRPRAQHLVDHHLKDRHTAEFWPIVAAITADIHLAGGNVFDALASIRTYQMRFRSVSTSHVMAAYLLSVRARTLVALHQARRAEGLFQGPFASSANTAASLALVRLYIGREHDAYIFSLRWSNRNEMTGRAALECLIVNAVAAIRLGNDDAAVQAIKRAESISVQTGLWSSWAQIESDDRRRLAVALDPDTIATLGRVSTLFDASTSVPRLTRREQVVLNLLGLRVTVNDMAAQLVVSPNTIKTQLQSLYRKLGVSDRASAIRAAHNWGLITDDLA